MPVAAKTRKNPLKITYFLEEQKVNIFLKAKMFASFLDFGNF